MLAKLWNTIGIELYRLGTASNILLVLALCGGVAVGVWAKLVLLDSNRALCLCSGLKHLIIHAARKFLQSIN